MRHHRLRTYRYLDACAEIEKCAALMYQQFSQAEQQGSELQQAWSNLANQERQHVSQVEEVRKVARRHKFGTQTVDCEQIRDLVRQAESCLSKALAEPYDPQTAFAMAISLETWVHDFHVAQAGRFAKSGLSVLHTTLAADDGRHIQELRDAYRALRPDASELQAGHFPEVINARRDESQAALVGRLNRGDGDQSARPADRTGGFQVAHELGV